MIKRVHEKEIKSSCCPNCGWYFDDLDADILEQTEDAEGIPNCREYTCPCCDEPLYVFFKVDIIEGR